MNVFLFVILFLTSCATFASTTPTQTFTPEPTTTQTRIQTPTPTPIIISTPTQNVLQFEMRQPPKGLTQIGSCTQRVPHSYFPKLGST